MSNQTTLAEEARNALRETNEAIQQRLKTFGIIGLAKVSDDELRDRLNNLQPLQWAELCEAGALLALEVELPPNGDEGRALRNPEIRTAVEQAILNEINPGRELRGEPPITSLPQVASLQAPTNSASLN